MNEEEKRKYEAFQYWIQTNTEKGVTTIPDNLCLFVINLIKSLQKENEELKDKYATFVKMSSEVIANSIPVQKVKDKIEEIQKEYNKLDKQIDEYINDVNKDLAKYYENKEKISIMQTLSCFIDTLQELLEGRK